VSYPRGMVARDFASVLQDGQPLGAISTWAPALMGVQGSVLTAPLRPASRTGSPQGGSFGDARCERGR